MIRKLKKTLLAVSVSAFALLGSQYASAGLLDIPCALVQSITSAVPLPGIGDLLCSRGG